MRLYRLLLWLLPPEVVREDGAEMVGALEDQLAEGPGFGERLAAATRAYRRLPLVLIKEWVDALGWGRTDARRDREREGGSMTGELMRHVRFGARTLRKNPVFTWASVVLISVGVGAVTTVYTIVDHVLLRPLPYPAADRLTYLTNGSHNGTTLEGLDDIEAFDLWAASTGADVSLTMDSTDPLRLRAVAVTPSFFPLFGARPALGRVLVEADLGDPGVAILTHGAWSSIWGSDPDIVGSTIRLDGEPVSIIGVLARDFAIPEGLVGRRAHLFRAVDLFDPRLENPGFHTHSVAARLAPGVGIDAAEAQIDALAERVAARHPDYYSDGPDSWPLQPFGERTVRTVEEGLTLLMGAVGLLLLVACANVAHLFMARGLTRSKEMAIRRAMGAGTGTLVTQLLVESLLVGVGGGVVGLALAAGSLGAVGGWVEALPRADAVALDLRIFVFAAVLAASTALLFGLLPALNTLGRDVAPALRRSTRGSGGGRTVRLLRGGLVAGEVAVSLVLVALAGLLLRSFVDVTRQDPGLEPEGAWVVPLSPSGWQTADEYRAGMGPIVERIESLDGVESVAWGLEAPFEHVGGDRCCWNTVVTNPEVEGEVGVYVHPVTDAFFRVFGIGLRAGSGWDASTVATEPPPVVVSEPLAVRMFGATDAAVGRELDFNGTPVRIAGVAEPTRHYGLDQEHGEALYLPVEELQFSIPRATVGLRAGSTDAGFAGQVREAIWSVEPELPVPEVVPLGTWVERSSATRRFASTVFGTFGIVGLLLAAGGLYGTLLYAVGQRRRELGIRLALGAGRGRIERRIVWRGLGVAALGVAVGSFLAWSGGRLVESLVFGVTTRDPVALAAAAAVLLATAALASWLPARRASRTDPMETLKAE